MAWFPGCTCDDDVSIASKWTDPKRVKGIRQETVLEKNLQGNLRLGNRSEGIQI